MLSSKAYEIPLGAIFLLILTKAEQFFFHSSFISVGTIDQEVAIIQLSFKDWK